MITKDDILNKQYVKLISCEKKNGVVYDKWDWRYRYYGASGALIIYDLSSDGCEDEVIAVFYSNGVGRLLTSLVQEINENDDEIEMITLNSVYRFNKNYELSDDDKELIDNIIDENTLIII